MNAKAEIMTREEPGQVVAADAGTIMAVISRAASDPTVNVEKLERLTALYERIKANEARTAYMAALAAMQPNLPVVEKRGRIKISKSADDKGQAYALWEDISEAIKPTLQQHGFTLSFRTGVAADGKITVTGILGHASGHQEETTITLPHDSSGSKNAVQAVGSSTSYGKRYTATALLNLTFRGEDDDGRAAGIGPAISADDAETLRAKIAATKLASAKFLERFRIERVEDLPASQLEEATRQLEERAAAIARKAARP